MNIKTGLSDTNATRIPFWDVSKAFLIYLVILGHCVAAYRANNGTSYESDILYRVIYEFHMPCFMMVSGFFAAKSINKYGISSLVKYAYRLLFPLIGFAVFQFIFVLDWTTIRPIRIYGAFFDLWFLPVLFECVVAYYVATIFKSRLYRVFMFFIIWIASACSIDVPYVNLAWVYCSCFVFMWPFFIFGSLICNVGIGQRKLFSVKFTPYLLGLAMSMYVFLLYIVPAGPYWWCGFYSIDTYMNFLMGICGCVVFLVFTALIVPYVQKCDLVLKVGQATLGIYILQFMYFAFPLPSYFVLPFGNDYISILVLSTLITLIMWCIYSLTRNIGILRLFLYGEARFKKVFRP